jgi:hypothetical protein
MPNPIPRAPPVTTAAFPSKRMSSAIGLTAATELAIAGAARPRFR